MVFKLPGHSGMGRPRGDLEELQGFVGSPWYLRQGVQSQRCLCKSLLLSLLPVLQVKAAVMEGLGKTDVERVDWAQRETSQHCLHKGHFALTREYHPICCHMGLETKVQTQNTDQSV